MAASSPSTKAVVIAHIFCIFQQCTSILVYSMGRVIMSQLPYPVLVFLRLAVVVPIILTAALIATRAVPLPRGEWRNWALIIASAIISMIGTQSLIFLGISMSSSTNASIISAPCTPIFTALFSVLCGIDKMSISKGFGFVFAISGALILLEVEKFSFEGKTLGNLLLAGSAVLSAANSLISRKLLDRGVHPLVAQGCICLSGLVVFGGTYAPMGLFSPSNWIASSSIWVYVFVLSIVGTAIPWCTSMYALKTITPMTVNVYVVLQPPLAVVVGVIMMNEAITWRQYVGTVLVLSGLVFVNANQYALKVLAWVRAKITRKAGLQDAQQFQKLAQEDPDMEGQEMVEQTFTLDGADVIVSDPQSERFQPDQEKIEIEVVSTPDSDGSCKQESIVKSDNFVNLPPFTAPAVAS